MLMRRRNLVLGGAGLGFSTLVGRTLERALLPTALGAAEPTRVVFVTSGSGVHHRYTEALLNATNGGPGRWDNGEASQFEPFAKLRDKFTLLNNFYCPYNIELHGNHFASMTMSPTAAGRQDPFGFDNSSIDANDASSASIDQVLAGTMCAGYPFRSINIGFERSARGASAPSVQNTPHGIVATPFRSGPVDAYHHYFGALSNEFHGAGHRKVRAHLNGDARYKLDQLESSLCQFERRLLEQSRTSMRAAPGVHTQPTLVQFSRSSATLSAELLAHAIGVGLSRVGFLHLDDDWPASNGDDWLMLSSRGREGLPSLTRHDIAHGDSKGAYSWAEMTMFERAIEQFHFQVVAEFYTKLQHEHAEAARATLVVWLSTGGGHHHSGVGDNGTPQGDGDTAGAYMHPVVLLGDPLGRLRTQPGGITRSYPFMQRSLSDVWTTVAYLLGVPLDSFGLDLQYEGVKLNRGPLSEILR